VRLKISIIIEALPKTPMFRYVLPNVEVSGKSCYNEKILTPDHFFAVFNPFILNGNRIEFFGDFYVSNVSHNNISSILIFDLKNQ
jgi:hypothetical protein